MLQVNLIKEQTYSFSRAIKNIITQIEKLIGIKNKNGTRDYESLIQAGWTFIVGLPIGLILLTNQFSVPIWFCIVSGTLIICNISNL